MFLTEKTVSNKDNSRGFVHLVPTIFIVIIGISALVLFSTQKKILIDKQQEGYVLSGTDEVEEYEAQEEESLSVEDKDDKHKEELDDLDEDDMVEQPWYLEYLESLFTN